MYETSNLAPEKLDNIRSETFSAEETKVCFFVRTFVSRVSAESILAVRDYQYSKFIKSSHFSWEENEKKYDPLKLKWKAQAGTYQEDTSMPLEEWNSVNFSFTKFTSTFADDQINKISWDSGCHAWGRSRLLYLVIASISYRCTIHSLCLVFLPITWNCQAISFNL